MNFRIEKISSNNYSQFRSLILHNRWGNITLPNKYESNIWGGIVLNDNQIIGGWCGIIRGDKTLIRWIAKSVYFDAYPIFGTVEQAEKYQEILMKTMYDWAKREHIIMFNLTHWVRGIEMPYLQRRKVATYLLPLQKTSEEQWKLVESKQRNIVRKGEKNGVKMKVLQGEDAIAELPTLQSLREQTQKHAISRNANASMLLKSDSFFENIIRHTDSTLFIGSVDNRPATAAIMIVSGETAYYYSGGSDYELNRQTGSSAYVIWKAIEYYREQPSVKYLDMGGVPVKPKTNHPAYGVYAFKRSFGGQYMEYDAGAIIINKFKYMLLKGTLAQRKILRLFSKSL